MSAYEYKVVPAPARAEKVKGVRAPEARFARAVENLMNAQAAEGWEYLRAETLPSEERKGLGGRTTRWRTVLVFRRPAGEGGRTGSNAPQAVPGEAPERTAPAEAMPLPGVLRAGREPRADAPARRRLWSVRRGGGDGDG
jgi:hypothetical protein